MSEVTQQTSTDPASPGTSTGTPSSRDSAVAIAAELLGGSAGAPTPPAETEQPAASPSGAVATVELPGLDAVRARAAERARARAEQEAATAPLRELQQQITARLDALPSGPVLPVAELRDPAKALEALAKAGVDVQALVQAGAKAQLRGKDPTQQLAEIIDAKLAPLLERLQPQQAQQQPQGVTPEVREQLADAFVQYGIGASAEYPNFARFANASPRAAATLALEYVDGLAAMGHDTSKISDAEIARAIEASLAPAPHGGANGAQPATGTAAAAGGVTTSAAAGGETRTTSLPGSITNGHAADAARTPPRNAREARDQAIALARSLGIPG